MNGWPRSINRRGAGIVCAIVALSLFAGASHGQTVEYFDFGPFQGAFDLTAPVSGVNFDFFFPGPFPPHLSGGVITGNEYVGLGLTIVQRDALPLNVISVFNAPGFFPTNSFGSPQVLSSSGAVGASNPSASDNIDFIFANPPTAAGIWIGNIGPGVTEVQFLGAGNAVLASEVFDATHVGILLGGGGAEDNAVFYGVTSAQPIHRIRTIEPGGDGDLVCYDHLVWGSRIAPPSDLNPPIVTIVAPGNGSVIGATQVAVSANVADASTTTVSSLPSGISTALPAGGGSVSGMVSLPAEGTNVLTVTAIDAGNLTGGTSVTVIRDTTAPQVTIESPLEGAVLANSPAAVSISVSDATATTVVLGLSSFPLPAGGGQVSTTVALFEGVNAIVVVVTDAGGNQTTATRQVILDLTAPAVAITSPANGAAFGPGESPVQVVASVDDASATTVSSSPDGVSGGLPPGGGAIVGSVNLAEGTNTIGVTATDAANRAGQAFVTVILDTTPPLVAIESPAPSSVARGSIDLHANAEDVAPGTGIARVDLLVDGAVVASLTTPPYAIAFDTAGLSDGPHDLAAVAVDGKGNSGSATTQVLLVDNTAPAVAITSPSAGGFATGTLTFIAAASDAGSGLLRVTMLAGGAAPTADGSATYGSPLAADVRTSQVLTTVLPDGSLLLSATAEDFAGNSATTSLLVIVDNTAPEKMLITPVDGAIVSGTMLIQAIANDPYLASIQLLVDGVVVATSTSSPISAVFDLSTVAGGTLVVSAVATDLAANSSSCSATVTVANLVAQLDPRTLNLKSKGGANSVTVLIEGAGVGLLMPTESHGLALRVPGGSPVPATAGWPGDDAVSDTDSDGIPELRIKFDRQALIAAIRAGMAANLISLDAPVPVWLVSDGTTIASDAIRIVGP